MRASARQSVLSAHREAGKNAVRAWCVRRDDNDARAAVFGWQWLGERWIVDFALDWFVANQFFADRNTIDHELGTITKVCLRERPDCVAAEFVGQLARGGADAALEIITDHPSTTNDRT